MNKNYLLTNKDYIKFDMASISKHIKTCEIDNSINYYKFFIADTCNKYLGQKTWTSALVIGSMTTLCAFVLF